jgi:flagellar protein FlbD
MIQLHRLNGKEFILNADMIKFIEATPDTVITLDVHGGKDEKFMVKEDVSSVLKKVREFRKQCVWPLEETKET